MAIQFNILRARKIKTVRRIFATTAHNLRLRSQANVDEGKSKDNQVIFDSLNFDREERGGLYKSLMTYYDGLQIKRKQDNVLMYEYVVTASPEFFQGKTLGQVKEWADHQSKFFQEQFGNNYKVAFLHLDEKTPHLHIICSTEIKSVKKYKNRYGSCEKETWSLNSKHIDPEFLVALHDKHAEWNKKFNLSRGVRGLQATHTELKTFYKEVHRLQSLDYTEKATKYLQANLEPKSRFGWVPLKLVMSLVNRFLGRFANLQKKLIKAKEDLDKLREKQVQDYHDWKKYKESHRKYTTELPFLYKKVEQQSKEIEKLRLELVQAQLKSKELAIKPGPDHKLKIEPASNLKSGISLPTPKPGFGRW